MADPIPRGPFDQGLFLTHYNKGRELFEAHRFEDAERQLEEAYLLRPRDPRVLNLLGLVYYRGDKLAKAEEVYRKLIAESPDAHTLHYNLGLVCFKLGRLEDAEAAFLKALELTPGNPKLHFYLGSIYERQQRYKDAIYQYRHAGAHILVQRLEGRMSGTTRPSRTPPARHDADATTPPHGVRPPLGTPPPLPSTRVTHAAAPVEYEPEPDTKPPDTKMSIAAKAAAAAAAEAGQTIQPAKIVEPVSPSLMAGDQSSLRTTRRFQSYDEDTTPPTARGNAALGATSTQAVKAIPPVGRPGPGEGPRDTFRALEKGLMEIEFSGKVIGSEPQKTTTSLGVTGTSVTTAPLATTTSTVGLTGTEQTTSTTAGASPSEIGAVEGGGSLPLTGAAIGGAAMLGAAAVAIGRAMSRAHRSGPIDQPPGDVG